MALYQMTTDTPLETHFGPGPNEAGDAGEVTDEKKTHSFFSRPDAIATRKWRHFSQETRTRDWSQRLLAGETERNPNERLSEVRSRRQGARLSGFGENTNKMYSGVSVIARCCGQGVWNRPPDYRHFTRLGKTTASFRWQLKSHLFF